MFDSIAHVDLKTGKRTTYGFAAGDAPGEPVFVPRSADAPEGDGWVIAVVYRGAEDRSDFVVFDAGRHSRPDRSGSPNCRGGFRSASTATGGRPSGFWERLRLAVRPS